MQHPTLKLASTYDEGSSRQVGEQNTPSADLQRAAADRLVRFLHSWSKKQPFERPIRVLDHSGARPKLLHAVLEQANSNSVPIDLTVVVESAVAEELLRDAVDRHKEITVVRDEALASRDIESFDCVHAALCLAHKRELPMLTALGKLERAMTPGFVWTDLADQLSKKQVRSYAERLDLGFCKYQKPLRSKLFTLSGVRRV